MTLAAITWNDAWSEKGQVEIENLNHAPVEVTTFGIILRHDDAGVSIASESLNDGSYRDITFIPAGMMISIKPLSIRTPRVKKPKETPVESLSGETPE